MASLQPNRGGMNVGGLERIPSAIAGAALVAFGLTRKSVPGVLMALAGSEMLYRGATGYCPVYGALGVNTAEKGASPNAAVMHNQNIQVKKTVTIDKPAEELYMFWRNFQNLPQFMRHLEAVEIIDETHSHWVAKGPAGRMVEWDAEIINEKPNELIAWKSMPGSGIPNAGSVLFKRAPGNRGTVVTVELDYAPPAGPIGAMVAKMFGEEPALQVDEDLHRFKQLMETGEIARTDGQPAGRKPTPRYEKNDQAAMMAGAMPINGKSNGNGVRRSKAKDTVQEASEESFPASDAPAWT